MTRPVHEDALIGAIQSLVEHCHSAARDNGWWEGSERNKGELLALIHSELSEALEYVRKPDADKHLPQYGGLTVELADAVIRIFDMAGALNLPLGPALVDKIEYNRSRGKRHGGKLA